MKREDFTEKDAARFWAMVSKNDRECWWWLGYVDEDGYGTLSHYVDTKKFTRKAHRIAYLLTHDTIDPSMTIDHLCRNRRCVNPAHLELVSVRENTFRGVGPASITERSTYTARSGVRFCRLCKKLSGGGNQKTMFIKEIFA